MKTKPINKEYKLIFEDWDFEKNDIEISKITKTSKEPIWWKCKHGHSYRVSVFSRIRSNGCKICNKPLKAYNARKARLKEGESFGDLHPKFLLEWDYEKNQIKPHEISEKSNAKIWFKCGRGHTWVSSAKRRVNGNNCLECYKAMDKSAIVRKQKLRKKGRSLADEYPELIKEWDYDKNIELPNAYSSGSNEKAHWKCSFGHSWEATIYNRTGNSSDCPYCRASTSKLEVFILTEMRKLFDEVVWRHKIDGYECDIYIPSIQTGIEVDGAYWHDDKIERDKLKFIVFKENNVRLIRVRDSALPIINGEVILYNKNSKYIDLSCEVARYLMINQKNATFSKYIENRTQIGLKEYKKILSLLPAPTEENSLSEVNFELSQEWDYEKNSPLTPLMFTPNSEKKVYWKCSKGHSWEAIIKNRHIRGSGCPSCYKQNAGEIVRSAILKKRGVSFGDKHPELLKEWDYNLNTRSPLEISPGSSLKAHWKCGKGHSWKASIGSRTGKGYGCPVCMEKNRSKKATQVRINKTGTLAEKFPDLIKEWDFEKNSLGPNEYPAGSKKRVGWICNKGHKWDAIIKSRTAGKGNCPTCQSIVVTNPELLNSWDFEKNLTFEPRQIKAGSNKKIWWICEKGHSYQQNTYEKLKGHQGCSTCRKINKHTTNNV